MKRSIGNSRFIRDVSIFSPASERNGYMTRQIIDAEKHKYSDLSGAFQVSMIDGPPLFSGEAPFLAEPGFNADDNTWRFAGHGRSTYHENPDIVAVGCSITSGIGVPREYSWPKIIEKFTGKKVNTCSRPASGVAYELFTATQMFEHYGKPQVVYAFLPDFFRAWVNTYVPNQFPLRTKQEHLVWSSIIGCYVRPKDAIDIYQFADGGNIKFGGKSRLKAKTFMVHDFQGFGHHLPLEVVVAKNFQVLDFFDGLCSLNDIDFTFCSWSGHVNDSLNKLNYSSFTMPANRSILNNILYI